ncbi:Tho complex subunit 7-domain-containing protein [Chiua virens]|nr:Tho complex subunit 7-domain-containing protein [Chiua virens]
MPPFVSRASWSSGSSENSTPAGRSLGGELFSASGLRSPTHPPASPDPSLGSSGNLDPLEEEAEGADTQTGPSARQTVPLTANHYVEPEMLMGISLGYNIPVISTELVSMTAPMPNVITLPYGKAPVFHFQAPSWRKLLKLMARLSGTRVEPTPDSFGIAKHDLKLRTVIQFVKIHHSASEWRTVLYLTTDYPVPSNLLNAHKYTNGDVTVLPYTYSLSPLPALLRDGSESQMAKYYVVPSTPTTPYPNLPINFPNLAMYLQSAVQDSRRAANDSSSGLRKLAQCIDGCYQTEAERVASIDHEVAGRRGVGDAIIHTRITNDERALRRIVKKFHNYASLAHTPLLPPPHGGTVDDAREAFLVELASFELALKKSLMVCEAESRQVEEYQRERHRIEQEHDLLHNQINELKVALEHAQTERRRKMEYDSITEKINTLPSREELEQSIMALENDMTAILSEHETQERIIRGQKYALDNIVLDLSSLRLMGKDKENTVSRVASPMPTPAAESVDADEGVQGTPPVDDEKHEDDIEHGEVAEKEEGEDVELLDVPLSLKPNTSTKDVVSHSGTPLSSQREPNSRNDPTPFAQTEDDDIEMGEVAEDPKQIKTKRKLREELEEGEASDSSSALSDPPDD